MSLGRYCSCANGRRAEAHQRGTVVTRPSARAPAAAGVVTLAGVEIPLLDETKHFKLIGTTGSGKSTAIREILTGALARGDRAIIADPDGGISGGSLRQSGATRS